MQYKELLRHPFWQKKRLAVFEREGFKCSRCQDDTENLQIHHWYYMPNTLPWDYPDDALTCVCELCHEKLEFAKWLMKNAPLLKKDFFESGEIKQVISLVHRRLMENHHKESARRYMESIKLLINGETVQGN